MRLWGWFISCLLVAAVSVSAETYVFDHTSTAAQETIVLNDILRACRLRLAGGQNAPNYCAADCATCTPNLNQKTAYIQDQGPTQWMQTKRKELRRDRHEQACTLYQSADDTLRAQVDVLAGMAALPTVGTTDTYSWSFVTTNPQERVIRNSLRQSCQAAISASQPPPDGCTAECNCSGASQGAKLDHLWAEAFQSWFDTAWQRIRSERHGQFCALYPDLERTVQDAIDTALGLPAWD